jgi:sugar lactone lactonase YvrE
MITNASIEKSNLMMQQIRFMPPMRPAAILSVTRVLSVSAIFAATIGVIASSARADILYVGTNSLNGEIDKITSAGAVSVFASLPGDSNFAEGLALDVSGNLYAAYSDTDKISKFTPAGIASVFKTLPAHSLPIGLAIDSAGNFYVANFGTLQISKITPAGALSLFATIPTGSEPAGLAFDSAGNLYMAESNHDKIYKYTSSGSLSLFATLPANSIPTGLAFDARGDLFVADDNFDQISRITPGGAVSLFATLPTASQPEGLAFDSSGNLYAAGDGGKVSRITATGAVSPFASGPNSFSYIAVTDDAGHPLALPPATLLGDYNRNGIVDAADYVVWRKGLGVTYNQNDFDIWRSHFGQSAGGGSVVSATAPVPEPPTLMMLMFAATARCLRRGRTA